MDTSSNNGRAKVQDALKATVCRWLGWSELEYGQFQYEMGLAYLRFYISGDQWGQDLLQRTRLFWAWWKNEWMARDMTFCNNENGRPPMSTGNLVRRYRHLHDATTLASDIYPGRMIMEESYSQMIGSLIKEVQHV
jgi:hypothetical protein